MVSEIKPRKLWAVVLVSLILNPVIGMCYVNKGRNAFFYFLASIILVILPCVLVQFDVLNVNLVDFVKVNLLIWYVIGAIHCCIIAKRLDYPQTGKWYSSLSKSSVIASCYSEAIVSFLQFTTNDKTRTTCL